MVQLIVLNKSHADIKVSHFNSTMVQLIAGKPKKFLTTTPLFQFYYGSINRGKRKIKCPGKSHFNSTMVQLIVAQFLIDYNVQPYFNSTMVQLIEYYYY